MPGRDSARAALTAFALALVAVVVTFAAGIAPLYERGLAFSAGWVGAALHLPLIAVLLGVSYGILVVRMKRTREEEGLTLPRLGEARGYVVGATAGLALPALLALGAPAAPAVAFDVRLAAWIAFGLSAWMQLLALHLLASTLRVRFGALAAGVTASAVFTAFHLEPATPFFGALTTFAFGGLDLLLVRRHPERASWATAVGFHGAWNSALAVFLGSPLSGTPSPWQSPAWPAHLGGAYGLEGSVLAGVTLVGLAWLAGAARAGPGFSTSFEVRASPEQTWAFLVDLANDARWREGVREMRPLGQPTDRGGRWSRHVEVRQVPGRILETEAVVVACDAPRVLAITRAGGPIRPQVRYLLSPTPVGTRVDFSLRMPLLGVWRLTWPLAEAFVERFVRPAARRDFARLGVLLEGAPPG